MSRRRGNKGRGQALVEFSIVLIPFLFLLMGVVDLGRGVYVNNGVAQAARELARVTSVHPCTADACTLGLGNGPETAAVLATQRGLVPGLAGPGATVAFQCTDITDAAQSNAACRRGQFVRVTVTVPFSVITPLLNMVAPQTFTHVAHVEIP